MHDLEYGTEWESRDTARSYFYVSQMSSQRSSEFQVYDPFHAVKPRTPMHLGNTSHKLDKYFQGENLLKKKQNLKCKQEVQKNFSPKK